MKSKKIMTYIGVFVIALFILNIYSSLLWDTREAASKLDVNRMVLLHIYAMICCFLFGVLLEWKRVILIFKNRPSIKISFSLILGLILLLIAIFPPMFYVMELDSFHLPFPKDGIGVNMFFGVVNQASNVQAILSVVAGTLIIKGISREINSV